jgi:hypothetical protein
MVWGRLKALYGQPRQSHEATAVFYVEEWWPILEHRDYDLANQAITTMKEDRVFPSFPMPGEFLRYYKAESGPRETDHESGQNDTERYYLRAVRLPKGEFAGIRSRAEDAVGEWIKEHPNMEGFEGKRIIFEIARIYALDRGYQFWNGVSEQEEEVPF